MKINVRINGGSRAILIALLVAAFCSVAAPPVSSAPPVGAAPAPVTLYPPTNVTTTSLTLTWTQSDASGFTYYSVRNNTSNSFSCGCTTLATINSRTQTSYHVTGLTPGKTYYFMIRVYTTTGTSDSNVINITMPTHEVDTTPPAVTIISPQNITYGADPIALNWTVNENATWVGYSLDGSELLNLTGGITLGSLPMGPHALTIYANDSSMNMGSSTVRFTVSYDATPPAIIPMLDSGVCLVEGGQMTISAIIRDDSAVGEAAIFYRIRGEQSFTSLAMEPCPTCEDRYEFDFYAPIGADLIIDYYFFASDGENNATFPSGAPGELYNITVSAHPPAVIITSPVNATNSSALLTWEPSEAADFQMYSLLLIDTQGAGCSVVADITGRLSSSYLVSGLAANATYQFVVRVYDTSGLFSDSEPATVFTLPNEPEPEPEPEPVPSWLSQYGSYLGAGAGAVAVAGVVISVYLRRKA